MNAGAEATAINLVQKQLLNSPNYIDYYKIKIWNGQLPVVSSNSGNILNLPQELLHRGNATQ